MTDELSRVCALFGQARERVMIVSAYIGGDALEQLLDAVPASVSRRVVAARWDAQDIATGATDWRVWDVVQQHGMQLLACPKLHAKIYVADDRALVGSANATASGMGIGVGNLELLVPVDTAQPDVSRVLTLVEQGSTEATPFGPDVSSGVASDEKSSVWLPDVSPEAFLAALSGRTSHTDATFRICAALQVAESGDQAEVRDAVQKATSFRVVKHEFDVRLAPMTTEQLRDLLSDRVDARLRGLSYDRLVLLVQWLGRFGANTHWESSGDTVPALYPGAWLAAFPGDRPHNE